MTGDPDKVLTLRIADIEIGERIGFFDADHAASLAASFAGMKQTTPIWVRRNPEGSALPWRLVSGRHRIAAAELLGWTEIKCIQVADADTSELMLRCLELSENDDRRSYRPVERAEFIEQEYRIAEALEHGEHAGENPHQRSIRLRWKNHKKHSDNTAATIASVSNGDAGDSLSPASNWLANLAASMGIADRTLRGYREIYRAIVEPFPDLAAKLNFHQIGEQFKHIHDIAKLEPVEVRRKVIETIIADPELDGLKAALIKCGERLSNGNRTLEHDRPTASFRKGWDDMTHLQKKAGAIFIAKTADLRIARDMYAELKKRRGIEGGGQD